MSVNSSNSNYPASRNWSYSGSSQAAINTIASRMVFEPIPGALVHRGVDQAEAIIAATLLYERLMNAPYIAGEIALYTTPEFIEISLNECTCKFIWPTA